VENRYKIRLHEDKRLVLIERTTPYLLRLARIFGSVLIFNSVLVLVVLRLFSDVPVFSPVGTAVFFFLVVWCVSLPLIVVVGALIGRPSGVLSRSSWEFDRGLDSICQNGRPLFPISQVSHISIRQALTKWPDYHLILNARGADRLTLMQSRNLEPLLPVAKALSSDLGVQVLYPDDGELSANGSWQPFDQKCVVIVNPRLSTMGAIMVAAFFGLWYYLLIPAFIGALVSGNLFVAAFVLIFVVVPLIGIGHFFRGIKLLFRREEWVFDGVSKSIRLNRRSIAEFNEIFELQLISTDNEGPEHELVLLRNDGKRIVVTRSHDSGIDIARQAHAISSITDLKVIKNARWRGWRQALRDIWSG